MEIFPALDICMMLITVGLAVMIPRFARQKYYETRAIDPYAKLVRIVGTAMLELFTLTLFCDGLAGLFPYQGPIFWFLLSMGMVSLAIGMLGLVVFTGTLLLKWVMPKR